MSREEEFLRWLSDQDYWVREDVVRRKWPDLEFSSFVGVTCKWDDDGEPMIPARDWRRHLAL